MAAGTPVTLAIRPEEILAGPGAHAGLNRLVTTIRGVQFLGRLHPAEPRPARDAETLLECDVAANAFAELATAEGALLPLALRPEALRMFIAAP